MPSPTALTLAYLRRTGHLVEVVERWIPGVNVRKDLFGIIDVLALSVDGPILGVQATTLSNLPARVAKACKCPALALWLKWAKFQAIGWSKYAGQWVPKIVELQGTDLVPYVLSRPPRRSRSRHRQRDLFEGTEAG